MKLLLLIVTTLSLFACSNEHNKKMTQLLNEKKRLEEYVSAYRFMVETYDVTNHCPAVFVPDSNGLTLARALDSMKKYKHL